MDKIEFQKLAELGYTEEEAELVLRVAATAREERDRALRSGVCACGRKLVLVGNGDIAECFGCDTAYAA